MGAVFFPESENVFRHEEESDRSDQNGTSVHVTWSYISPAPIDVAQWLCILLAFLV